MREEEFYSDDLSDSVIESKTKRKKALIITFCSLLAVAVIVTTVLIFIKKPKPTLPNDDELVLEVVIEYLSTHWDEFNIDGSTSMVPLHQVLNDKFSKKNVEIKHSRTVEAFEKLIKGENDILLGGDFSAELLSKAKKSGVDLVSEEITREGFVFLVNKNNKIRNLSEEQIRGIYSGKITDWSELGGKKAEIIAFQRNDDAGSQLRMKEFMGKTPLIEKTYVAVGMEELVIMIADFDHYYDDIDDDDPTQYAIGYSMYTFAEKQFSNDDVILMSVNGVAPTDDSIFDESYPLIVYNYMFYDKNCEAAAKFGKYLLFYLLSSEGQGLISKAGYVNLNEKYDRTKGIELPDDPDEDMYVDFYNPEKGEFYRVADGKLLAFNNYPDFLLYYTDFTNNAKVRAFAQRLFDSGIIATDLWDDEEEEALYIFGFWPDDEYYFTNVRYQDQYYSGFAYLYNENKYLLLANYSEDLEYIEDSGLKNFNYSALAFEDVVIGESELNKVFFSLREQLDYDLRSNFKKHNYLNLK